MERVGYCLLQLEAKGTQCLCLSEKKRHTPVAKMSQSSNVSAYMSVYIDAQAFSASWLQEPALYVANLVFLSLLFLTRLLHAWKDFHSVVSTAPIKTEGILS